MNSVRTGSSSLLAAQFLLTGIVQGVGMRPTVARLARDHQLAGFVRNGGGGVEIHVQGHADQVEAFAADLRTERPPSSQIHQFLRFPAKLTDANRFEIRQSDTTQALATIVPPDLAACPTCLAEALNPSNKRYFYPFGTCADCGPRYSLMESMPFDRSATSMHVFELCSDCASEYGDFDDRRFHAQTNGCSACGPRLRYFSDANAESERNVDELNAAVKLICGGGIVAVKGVGGYQLICDATCANAVKQLRLRKRRPTKPLAVMALSVEQVETFARLSEASTAELRSRQNAIVVVPLRLNGVLCAAVSCGLVDVGVMLPTSPLHALLLANAGRPCVVTSGNCDGDGLVFRTEDAVEAMQGIADGWLHHNRKIVRPVDDSVVRMIANRRVTIRAARGLAPMSLQVKTAQSILATGGHQKVAIALSNGTQAVLGPHLGDMNSIHNRQRFAEHVLQFCELYQTRPTVIAHDLHPDYFTTRWAATQNVRKIAVQHHHAHVVAGMIEHGWLDRQVLGVAFDGTGYGTDGTIWGGEFLICTENSFRRIARFRPFPLVGGDRAVKEPWRIAAALLHGASIDPASLSRMRRCSGSSMWGVADQWQRCCSVLENNRSMLPLTSSLGRLFDGVAALLLNMVDVSFEGEAAMRLESACELNVVGKYRLTIRRKSLMELDWRPMLRDIVCDLQNGIATGTIATKFTRSIATAVAEVCEQFPKLRVVLSGGCFQNAVLTEFTAAALKPHPQPVGFPGLVPCNDGGLSAGQLAIAAAQLRHGRPIEGGV